MNVSSVKNLNGEVLSAVQDASLTNVVQTNSGNWQDITAYQNASAKYLTGVSIPESATWNEVSTTVQSNSAQWAEGGGAISSYTTTWSYDVPPYGDHVINSLNEKYISAFISNSADKSKFANNANSANSANYAETVNETYLENKGFARNLSSEYGTISVIHNNIIESTNSAISRVGNVGFVSSFEGQSIGPEGNGTATYSWEKALPNTIINLDMSWSNNEILTYSANTNLTGEIVLPTGVNTQTINIPNATEFKVWSNRWIRLEGAVVSAADQFETVVGELAWASALPTYEYDNTNKISAINGSALAGGNTEVESYVVTNSASIDETVGYVQTNSATINDVNNSYQTNSGTFLTAQEVSHDNTLSGNGTVESPLGIANGYIQFLSVNQPYTADNHYYESTASVPAGYDFLCWVNMCTNGFSQIFYPLDTTSTTCTWWLAGSMTNPHPDDSVDSRYLVIKKA